MDLAENDDMIQALAADRPDQPFSDSITSSTRMRFSVHTDGERCGSSGGMSAFTPSAFFPCSRPKKLAAQPVRRRQPEPACFSCAAHRYVTSRQYSHRSLLHGASHQPATRSF